MKTSTFARRPAPRTENTAVRTIQANVQGHPNINRMFQEPFAIAVLYTNSNDQRRAAVLHALDVHLVDDCTANRLTFPERHLTTGYQAVAIYGWSDKSAYEKYAVEKMADGVETTWTYS